MSEMKRRPAGLTGGIASGKSTVASCFERLGATIIDGDRIAAETLVPGSAVLGELSSAFGSAVIQPDGRLDRSEMLALLIQNPLNMRIQLDILAPWILPAIDRAVQSATDSGRNGIIVEAPLLFEYGRVERYGTIITVVIPREKQVERLMARSGKSREWASRVVDLQIPIDQKAANSEYRIDNSGPPNALIAQVESIFRAIRSRDDLL